MFSALYGNSVIVSAINAKSPPDPALPLSFSRFTRHLALSYQLKCARRGFPTRNSSTGWIKVSNEGFLAPVPFLYLRMKPPLGHRNSPVNMRRHRLPSPRAVPPPRATPSSSRPPPTAPRAPPGGAKITRTKPNSFVWYVYYLRYTTRTIVQ